ncbi:MAG: metal-dependent transcriptional regulator [bacterium]
MSATRPVSLAQEDCLEAVLRLQQAQGAARVRDLSAALGVHKSTVVATLKRLAAQGLVTHARYGLASLTPAGTVIASRTGARHELLRAVLAEFLLLDPAAADANACRLEHALDAAAHQRLREAVGFADARPRLAAGWRRSFRAYLAGAKSKGRRSGGIP